MSKIWNETIGGLKIILNVTAISISAYVVHLDTLIKL